MKKLLTGMAFASALTTAAFAESAIVDLSVGSGSLSFDKPTVAFGDSATATFSLDLNEPSQSYKWAQFDHFLPIVPNIRVEQTEMKFEGLADTSVTFNQLYTVSTTGLSTLDISNQDIIAYWGVPFSTWLPMIDEADFGLGVKQFDGALTVATSVPGVSTTETIDAMLPYLYVKLHITPPFMGGLGIEAEVKTLSLDAGIEFQEQILKLDWGVEAPIPVIDMELGLEAGMRTTTLTFDADGTEAFIDVDFSSIFFGVYGKFGI